MRQCEELRFIHPPAWWDDFIAVINNVGHKETPPSAIALNKKGHKETAYFPHGIGEIVLTTLSQVNKKYITRSSRKQTCENCTHLFFSGYLKGFMETFGFF
jgi:hypothetical protein